MVAKRFPVRVQYRHLHLSQADQDRLFGPGKTLAVRLRLGHDGQYVCEESIDVVGKHGVVERVAILGPVRAETQLELSATDAFALGIDAPVRVSGDLGRSAACRLRGPAGEIAIKRGAIVPARHLHLDPETAAALRVSHLSVVTLYPVGREKERIDHVTVRVHPSFENALHLTVDEAGEMWLRDTDEVGIV